MNGNYSTYYDTDAVASAVEEDGHREFIGGLWDELGILQLNLLTTYGLAPEHRLLDVGCGSLRGGIHFVRFLNSSYYYGTDLNQALLDAGYERELVPLGLQEKLPKENLIADTSFEFGQFNKSFDRALAFSVFTHLQLNSIRICLEKLAKVMRPDGIFHATFFELPKGAECLSDIEHPPGDIVTHGDADPYHYRFADLQYAAEGLPWRVEYVGEFGHPRGQRLVNFVRLPDERDDRVSASQRSLSVEESNRLLAGDDHYRAYVGPPERYDFMSATQFALLFQMGMRDRDKILDFGCGSLRLGRLLIPFLQADRYFGIDPNKWLIDDGIENELGADIVRIKRPRFDFNCDYNCEVFGTRFDFIMAQSIVTHTGRNYMNALFASVAGSLDDGGLFLFSYIRSDDANAELPADGWHYPGCVGYTQPALEQMLAAHGLKSVAVPWFHPGAAWHAAALTKEALPGREQLMLLNGAVLREEQWKASALGGV